MARSQRNGEQVLTDGYFASIARAVGVPPFWMDDCLQEIKVRLWKAGPDTSASLAGVIAQRASIDFMRSNGRRRGKQAAQVSTFSELAARQASPESDEPLAELGLVTKDGDPEIAACMIDLRDALATLQGRERTIISLYVLYGFPLWRIGEQLGISPSRVQQLLSRSIVKVRRLCGTFDIGAEVNGDIV